MNIETRWVSFVNLGVVHWICLCPHSIHARLYWIFINRLQLCSNLSCYNLDLVFPMLSCYICSSLCLYSLYLSSLSVPFNCYLSFLLPKRPGDITFIYYTLWLAHYFLVWPLTTFTFWNGFLICNFIMIFTSSFLDRIPLLMDYIINYIEKCLIGIFQKKS